jgi:dethiobiotin synthetase
MPKHRGLFITGTDTGVGKTLIAGAIARVLASQGLKVGVFKPVASGCRRDREGLVSADAEFLAFCADCDYPLSVVSPVCFSTPAAPAACEPVEKRTVDFEHIANMYRYICDNTDIVIVEGIGGIRVPVSQDIDVLDMAKAFALPVVVVARPDLGTINHTLLTVDAVRRARLPLRGVVISGCDMSSYSVAVETAPDIIAKYGNVDILAVVPFDDESSVEKGLLSRAVTDIISQIDWCKLAKPRRA